MKDVYKIFLRKERIEIATIIIIKFIVADEVDPSKIIEKFIDVITQWVNTTDEGKKAWEYSCEDFNIGDLASYEEEVRAKMFQELIAAGIHHFEILGQLDTEEIIDFDTVLVDSSKIKRKKFLKH